MVGPDEVAYAVDGLCQIHVAKLLDVLCVLERIGIVDLLFPTVDGATLGPPP